MQTNNENQEIFPPISYFWKIVKRHSIWLIAMTLPIFLLTLWGLSELKLQYKSSSSIIFDPRDSALSTQLVQYPDFDQISSAFLAIPTDSRLLDTIAEQLSLSNEGFDRIEKPFYQTVLAGILPEQLIPNAWLLEGQFYQQMIIRNFIVDSLTLQSTPLSYELNLETRGKTPNEAQLLNEVVADVFIKQQLKLYADRIKSNLDTFDKYQIKEKQTTDGLSEVFSLYDKQTTPLNLSSKEKKDLKDQERSLVNQIVSSQREQEQTLSTEIQRKLSLEGELTQLLTQKGPTHPEVIQKTQELKKIKDSRGADRIKNQVTNLTKKLIELQARMKRAGIPIDTSLQLRNLTEDSQLFLSRLGQIVKEHKLELENIDDQITNKDSRTRFRYSVPPSLENALANKKQLILAIIIGLILVVGTAKLVILLREFYSPVYYDAWKYRVANRHTSILGILDAAEAKKLSTLAPSKIPELIQKSSKLRPSPIDSGIQTIRKAFHHSIGGELPKCIYFSFVGQNSFFDHYGELLGAVASTTKQTLVMDLSDTILPKTNELDLIDFLEGRCKWKDIKIKKTDTRSYDMIISRTALSKTGTFDKDGFHNLVAALRKQYDCIIILGFAGQYFVENSSIARNADCWIEFIDLSTCSKKAAGYNSEVENYRPILISAS